MSAGRRVDIKRILFRPTQQELYLWHHASSERLVVCFVVSSRAMIALNAHFDGKVIIPDEPLDLPANQRIRIQVEPMESTPAGFKPRRSLGQQRDLVVHLAPDWEASLPDDIWDQNADEQAKP